MKKSLNNRWKLFVYIVLGFIVVCTAGSVYAQQIEEGETKRYRKIVPIPIVFYSQETGLSLDDGGLYYVNPLPEAVVQQPDTINAIGFYITKRQILVAVQMDKYFVRSGNNLNVNAAALKFPDKFWGIGPNTPDSLNRENAGNCSVYYAR